MSTRPWTRPVALLGVTTLTLFAAGASQAQLIDRTFAALGAVERAPDFGAGQSAYGKQEIKRQEKDEIQFRRKNGGLLLKCFSVALNNPTGSNARFPAEDAQPGIFT